jgi:acyl-[acyl carrier protein]--UDP-N-acetylglucosamine O-acyltransferase
VERIRAEIAECPEVEELVAFIGESQRGVIK